MKKTYAGPTLMVCGSVAHETLDGGPNTGMETWTSRFIGAGAVGYYL
jgi:hypothetical protein